MFLATDQCGNTATCVQAITVTNVPCGFTPLFAIGPTVCGSCTGSISTTMSPPGSYTFLWENGQTGPNISGLCPGPIQVTITDVLNECSDIFTPVVEDVPMLFLTVVQVFPPSSFSASDGRVVLQVAPPSAQPPFLVFVNGNSIGTVNTHMFQIINMPAGEYVIWVVSQNGQGCLSNEVYVEMFPPEAPPAAPQKTEIGFWPGLPGVPATAATGGGLLSRSLLSLIPEHPPEDAVSEQYAPGQSLGVFVGMPLGRNWQLCLELARQAGVLQFKAPASGWTAQAPVLTDWQMLGLRRYFPTGASRCVFFQENSVSRTVLTASGAWLLPQQTPLPATARSELWQLGVGGGVRFSLSDLTREFFTKKQNRVLQRADMGIGEHTGRGEKRQARLELGGQMLFHTANGGRACAPFLRIRLIHDGLR